MHATQALAVDAPSLHMCTNEWFPTASTFCPLSLPCKKYKWYVPVTLKQSSIDQTTPKISWLLVAVLNTTHCV